MPNQALSQHTFNSGNQGGSNNSNFQGAGKVMLQSSYSSDHSNAKSTLSHGTSSQTFHRPHPFRPRLTPNKGQDDSTSGLMYDGKRMRKAIHRKTVDYNPSVLKYLQSRIWQRDRRDQHHIQPDSLYAVDLIPPSALLERPMNCVTTRFVRTSTNKFRCPIFCLTWTPEGRRLVTGASSGEFTLWNGLTFNFETILQAHETAVRAMRWSHADAWMVTADHAGYIKYWQSNMNNVKMYQAHKEPIRGISFCPSDTKFASCSDDGTVRIWDFMRCHEERILRGHGADVRCVDWHPQKALLASGSKDNQQPVKLWDPRTGNSLATLHAHKHTVMDLKWHQNGNWMLTASRDHLLKLFDIRNLKEELQTFKGHKREATAIGWHPIHEGLFVSGSADGALMFWMVGCDHEVGGMEEAHEGMVWSVAWHPLGHILASGSNDHATKFWTRNRPGDEMRDKYNLNTLPVGMIEQELLEYTQESAAPNLPGMGLEHGLPEHLQIKGETQEPDNENELPSIPGLDWEEDAALLRAEERAAHKKVPYARPVPKMFEQAWAGEIDVDQIKKEQQQQQQQPKPPFLPPTSSSLLFAQQVLGVALAGTLRQHLAAGEAGRLLLPGGPLMLGAGGPRMFIAPGQPVLGPRGPGQMLLIPGGPGGAPRPMGSNVLQQPNNANSGPQQKTDSQGSSGNADSETNSQSSVGPHTGIPGAQQGPPSGQAGRDQNQQGILQGNSGPRHLGPPVSQMQMGIQQNNIRPPQGQGVRPPPHGQMGEPLRPPGHKGQVEGPERFVRPGLLGPSEHLRQGPPMMVRQPGPQSQGPVGNKDQLSSGPKQHGNRDPMQDMDKDERFPGHNQTGATANIDMDLDYRPRVYNGPVGPLNLEDQDFRQQRHPPGQTPRQNNAGDPRNNGRDFQGAHRGQMSETFHRGHGLDSGYNEEEYGDYQDMDERVMHTGDYDHRIVARGRGVRGRGGYGKPGGAGGWDGYEGNGEEGEWDGGDGAYGESYDDGYGEEYYEEQEDVGGDNWSRKRAWEEGPGMPRGRGSRGGWGEGRGRGQIEGRGRGQVEGRGRGRAMVWGNRGRGGPFRGSGWGRGAMGEGGRGTMGERGGWVRGGQRGRY